MNFSKLIHTNICYFSRYYRLVAAAVLITVAVIVGSLVVGDSVRTTLVKRVAERLGDTETVIFSRNSFMNEDLSNASLFENSARGFLLTNGFISRDGKLIPVFVWGTDDSAIDRGSAKINSALAKELEDDANIVLRLPASGLVPSGSLFVTENYTTSLRLNSNGIIKASEGGNISMKNEQIIPLNIFVNREELAEVLETPGKINLILTSKKITAEDFYPYWNYEISGLSVNSVEDFTEITSDRVFLQKEVMETVNRNNRNSNRLFSYLANSIERKGTSVPYSFVTAIDSYQGESLQKDEIILSDYTARRLQARPGDSIEVSYFISKDLKTLENQKIKLRLKKIVPIKELQEDKTLSAEFPGLSDVERCTEWDSDLPIDMNLITDEDEDYWERYRSTPKAIVSYDAVASDWSNAYGNATAIRLTTDPNLSELTPEMFGIQLIHPRKAGLYAAKNGVDFAGLFLALGFFIIISSLLLMLIPLSEMISRRRHEIILLKSLGYSHKRIIAMLWKESAPVAFISSLFGIIVGLLYTFLIMWLLENVWKGATHTDGFAVYPSFLTLFIGLVVGVGLSLWILRHTIVKSLKNRNLNSQLAIVKKQSPSLLYPLLASILTLVIIGINFLFLHSVILFVLVGIIMLGTAALWGNYLTLHKGSAIVNTFRSEKLVWNTLLATKKQALLSFFSLSIGVFIVFSVGLNRKGFADSSQIRTGTGGYSLWCETSIPVYHNMTTQAGREKLSLTSLSESSQVLQCLRYSADDASCLNLNKVTTPTVLGIDMNALSESYFQIEQTIFPGERFEIFEHMQFRSDSVYPALIDATVLTWGLMMQLGDTLYYENDKGKQVAIQLVGTLSNSIFQGHILIDRALFSEIWEETTGSEIFLLKVSDAEIEQTQTLLSRALNEYGVRVSTTNDRLKQFNTVTDTYLTIFLTLGGLGLLLGIMSFIIVVRKNLAGRHQEIDLYRSLGFTDRKIEQIFYKENLLVPLYAIISGVISALIGVGINFMNTGIGVWLLAVLFTAFFVICLVVFIRIQVRKELFNVEAS